MMNTKLNHSTKSITMFRTSVEGYWPSLYILSAEQNQKPANIPATNCGEDRGRTEVLEGCSVS